VTEIKTIGFPPIVFFGFKCGGVTVLAGKYQKTQLENGIRVVTETVPHIESVSLGVWILVGSRDESESERGISHFLEHMLFKGTEKRDTFAIANCLESLGGSLDAFTYRDLTCLYVRCLHEHLDEALDLLADMIQNSVLDPVEIEKEQTVVTEEIQNVEDTPDDLIHDLFAKSIWNAHPMGEPILGTRETVGAFDRNILRGFLERHYRPDRIVISAAGKVDHDLLAERVREQFAMGPSTSPAWERERPGEAVRCERHFTRDIGQTHICLGTTAYAYTHPRQYDLIVANTALGGGMSSRLFQQVREHLGLAYSVYSYVESLEDTGIFGTYVACDRKRVPRSIEVVKAELARFRENGITSDELSSCKAQLRSELIMGVESMDRRMSRVATEEIYTGRYFHPEDILASIDGVNAEGVLEAARTHMDEDRMQLVTVGP
jgi:predicted Zn-dependent peptidase